MFSDLKRKLEDKEKAKKMAVEEESRRRDAEKLKLKEANEQKKEQLDAKVIAAENYLAESRLETFIDELKKVAPDIKVKKSLATKGFTEIMYHIKKRSIFSHSVETVKLSAPIYIKLEWNYRVNPNRNWEFKDSIEIGIDQNGTIYIVGDFLIGWTIIEKTEWKLNPLKIEKALEKAYLHHH